MKIYVRKTEGFAVFIKIYALNIMETFPGVEELTINPAKVLFRDEDIIGSGDYDTVYRATNDGINYDDKVVVKKIRLSEFEKGFFTYVKPMFQRFYKNKIESMRREVNAQNKFSQNAVSPRVFFADYEKMYYVMERMDKTLENMFRDDEFSPELANKMIDLFERSFSTNYIHMNITVDNVMWSDKLNDFRLIDWGMFIKRSDVKDPRMRSVIHDGLIWQLQWIFKLLTDKNPERWSDVHARYLQFVRDNCFYDDKEKCLVFSPQYAEKVGPEVNARIEKNIRNDYPNMLN